MRQETNNEMDLLLRRLSRQQAGSKSDAALRGDGEHLDADELSSYAENALPAAARARYTEHLAECSRCRELVVGLSASVGVVAQGRSTVLEPSGFRKFLASLFTPMVLRYAAPALGLMAVAVIGLVVFRSNRQATFTAQVERAQPAPATAMEQPQAPAPGQLPEEQEKPASTAATVKNTADRSKGQLADANAAAPSVAERDAFKEAPLARSEQQPIANAPPAKQPEPTPTVIINESKRVIELQAAKPPPLVQSAPATASDKASEPRKSEDRRSDELGAASTGAARTKGETSGSTAAQDRRSMAKIQRDSTDEKDLEEAETRSVAGRRFRKQRGMWIDTAYDSSRSVVSLSRGSEQYRALVADEPAIKTIAEQLDGEVIVVWKNRAYRIR